MWNEKNAKAFFLGCLYGFEKNNINQELEFNCPNLSYLIDLSVLLRMINVPYHVDKKGIRLLVITEKIKYFESFLQKNFRINYEYPSKLKWPEVLDEQSDLVIPFIDGVFETAGMYNPENNKFPFILHLQSEKLIKKISDNIQDMGIDNIWIKNPHIKSVCTLQIIDGDKFKESFLKTNPSSKYVALTKDV